MEDIENVDYTLLFDSPPVEFTDSYWFLFPKLPITTFYLKESFLYGFYPFIVNLFYKNCGFPFSPITILTF
jgi:hypothetical protein